jgi:hypothetical protein
MLDGTAIQSAAQTSLHLPSIPASAQIVHLFPQFKNHSLLSIGQFCDVGCSAVFTKTNVTISDSNNQIVLQGNRDPQTKLWMMPVQLEHENSSTAPMTEQSTITYSELH